MSNKHSPEHSLKVVWHLSTQMKQHETMPLIAIARGEGVWLFDADGKRYLDAIGSWRAHLFGHANSRINAAISDLLYKQLEHVMLAGFTHEPVVELSERLSKLVSDKLGLHDRRAGNGTARSRLNLFRPFFPAK